MDSTFHSVGQNFFKLISVLENGIVSEKFSKGISSYSRNFGGYNGASYVSLSRYGSQSFKNYSQKGFSLMVSPDVCCIDADKTSHDSGIQGEVFHYGIIFKEDLQAIVCPEHLIDLPIRDLRVTIDIGTGFVDSVVRNILEQMGVKEDSEERREIEFLIKEKANAPEGMGILEKIDYEKEYIFKIDVKLAEIVHDFFSEKLDKEDVTVKDMM